MSDVEDVLRDLNITVTATRGRSDGSTEYQALCPHHHAVYDKAGKLIGTKQDHRPDWWINGETGLHKCWSCGFTGSLEWLVHKVTGMALKDAADKTNLASRSLRRVRQIDPWGGERPVELPPMNEARIKMYGTPPEWALKRRRLTAEDCERYGIRWADPFIHGSERAEYENCWITPIRHPADLHAIGMQVKQEGGSRFFRNLPASVPKRITVFGVEHLNGGPAQVVESPLDAPYGYRLTDIPTVATMGTAISDEQMELLIERADRLIFALDDDDAGLKALRHVLGLNPGNGRRDRRLQDYSKRIPIFVANYSEAFGQKDIGDMPPSIARPVLLNAYSSLRLTVRL